LTFLKAYTKLYCPTYLTALLADKKVTPGHRDGKSVQKVKVDAVISDDDDFTMEF